MALFNKHNPSSKANLELKKKQEEEQRNSIIELIKDCLPNNKNRIKKERPMLTTKQKLILFNELGFLKVFNDNPELSMLAAGKKASLIALIFGNEGIENIRKDLSNLKELYTDENIEAIENIFNNLGLDRLALQVSKNKK